MADGGDAAGADVQSPPPNKTLHFARRRPAPSLSTRRRVVENAGGSGGGDDDYTSIVEEEATAPTGTQEEEEEAHGGDASAPGTPANDAKDPEEGGGDPGAVQSGAPTNYHASASPFSPERPTEASQHFQHSSEGGGDPGTEQAGAAAEAGYYASTSPFRPPQMPSEGGGDPGTEQAGAAAEAGYYASTSPFPPPQMPSEYSYQHFQHSASAGGIEAALVGAGYAAELLALRSALSDKAGGLLRTTSRTHNGAQLSFRVDARQTRGLGSWWSTPDRRLL